ncbi:glutathione S-transferase family protein [Halorubellus sp. JP-L1]|uniref:glutathione S-transferase family protein n=1 Tax=Halorubellus sp. JP-L1 TaxID=2715753 RepID=UPI001407A55C|nr:glutathione S-transferase family protein [Halorubellus sp. JP-L1]NHN40076.1 glutathione S-transferase family protein [Halorubellus sp. JP-L1]
MNMLVDGEWRTGAYESTNDDGEFDRQETSFRDWIQDDPSARFPPEANRYHLYVSRACPWAHRAAMTRAILGLEDVVSMDVVDPYRDADGWQFTPSKDDCTEDTVTGADYLREVYTAADDDFTGRVTVPVLWDREEETVVNNESEEIVKMLADAFGEFASNDVDLYPEGRRDEVDAVIDAIYEPINNGVYRAGFAGSQSAHEAAVEELFEALEHWNDVLSDQRWLVEDRFTLADVCLFTTLVRFDEVYHTHFKCNVARVTDFDALWGHTRDVYQTPGVAATVNMDHVKEHYYTTHTDLNPTQLVPVGPGPAFDAPHDRDALAGVAPLSE